MNSKKSYCLDDSETYTNKELIRRRFYLSKESLDFFDALCVANKETPSVLLEKLILGLKKKQTGCGEGKEWLPSYRQVRVVL